MNRSELALDACNDLLHRLKGKHEVIVEKHNIIEYWGCNPSMLDHIDEKTDIYFAASLKRVIDDGRSNKDLPLEIRMYFSLLFMNVEEEKSNLSGKEPEERQIFFSSFNTITALDHHPFYYFKDNRQRFHFEQLMGNGLKLLKQYIRRFEDELIFSSPKSDV